MEHLDPDKLDKLEKLKNRLFSKAYETDSSHRQQFPHFEAKEVSDDWQEETDNFQNLKDKLRIKTSMFKKFFIFSIVFFVLALSYSSYVFFVKNNTVSNDNIEIAVLSNAFTDGGEEYPLLLNIVNKNNADLLLADLVIEYPKSSESTLSSESERLRLSLGTIPVGSSRNENVRLILFGEQGSVRPIKIALEYRVEGSNAIFLKEKLFDVSINSTPINISVEGPKETTSNREFELNVSTTLNSTRPASNMLLRVDYPLGFKFTKSSPEPAYGNNVWSFGDMAPGVERKIKITGQMIDVYESEEKIFRVWSGSHSSSDKMAIDTVFNSLEHPLLISKSSIEARIVLNGSANRDFSINTQSTVTGQIYWTNNLDTRISNMVIRAKITGNAVDRKSTAASQGFYNSSEDTIIWDKNSISQFGDIEPGESGNVSFTVSSLPLFSTGGGLLSSPVINIDVSVSGSRAGEGSGVTQLGSTEAKTISIISDVGFANKGLFYSGPFTNTGPMPPKAEAKTTYTIVWTLSNTANNISKAKVSATLPSWVTFANRISPASEDVTYDSSTREVVWSVGSIPRGASITRGSKEVFFQVELLPSLSQLNTNPVIINGATLTGHDDFANVDIRVNKPALNTRLSNDTIFPPNNGRVVE